MWSGRHSILLSILPVVVVAAAAGPAVGVAAAGGAAAAAAGGAVYGCRCGCSWCRNPFDGEFDSLVVVPSV